MTDPKLAGTDLVLAYPDGSEPVVDGESVRISRGRITAFVGPNGSGKSTLLRGLADQLSPLAGEVVLDGRAVARFGDRDLARELGLLEQEPSAPDGLTVERLVSHGRYPHRGRFDVLDDADLRAVERALSLAGVSHLRDRPLGDLSGGQRRLAWLAMVLAQDPDVPLLDEPTTFLDLRHLLAVMAVVERRRDEAGTTVVLVLHDVEQAARHADEMIVLDDGAVRAHGAPETVLTPALLAGTFGVEATVEPGPHGPRVIPRSPVD